MRLALLGAYSNGNLGDLAILEGMVSSLRQEWPEVEILTLSENPRVLAQRFPDLEHEWTSNRVHPAVVRKVNQCDALLLGGGDILQQWPVRSAYKSESGEGWLTQVDIPIIVYGASLLGGVEDQGDLNELTDYIIERSAAVMVRDWPYAIQEKITVMACPGSLVRGEAEPKERFRIGCCLVAFEYTIPNVHDERIYREIAATLDNLVNHTEGEIVFFEQHRPHDISATGQTIAYLESPVAQIIGDMSATEYASWLASCDLVISARLHATMLATCHGVPTFALAYKCDVSEYMRRIQCGTYVADAPRYRGIEDGVMQLYINREAVKETMAPHTDNYRVKAANSVKVLAGVLEH